MRQVLKVVGGSVLLAIVVLALAVTIVPRFLDRIYYRGPASAHFDGERFANPDNDADTQQIQPARPPPAAMDGLRGRRRSR